jgi:hypothetical protein
MDLTKQKVRKSFPPELGVREYDTLDKGLEESLPQAHSLEEAACVPTSVYRDQCRPN